MTRHMCTVVSYETGEVPETIENRLILSSCSKILGNHAKLNSYDRWIWFPDDPSNISHLTLGSHNPPINIRPIMPDIAQLFGLAHAL
jgi:hypothetical protein